ncbi:hypothetical protein Barb6XT_03054 [Bacteroidales bacterium Barb6XT]|nr:hypothetical protein Barb6XT_03054 [Bacteroidales bacterium Barb6XT]
MVYCRIMMHRYALYGSRVLVSVIPQNCWILNIIRFCFLFILLTILHHADNYKNQIRQDKYH